MTSAKLTERLRAESGETWTAVVEHPFTDALALGDIDEDAMRYYLIQDHRFVDAFVVLLASMVAAAPTLKDRIPGCQFLGLVTGKENTYFERSLDALGVTNEQRLVENTPNDPATTGFQNLMRSAAKSGSYTQMLAVLVVAEWSYLSWGDRVKNQRNPQKPFWCMEWIDLHCGEYFESVIAYLRGLLDTAGETMTAEEEGKCRAIFLEAVQLEKAFFDAAWAKRKL
mmetsp:Transcript_54741/g.88718  ORF Transcript_54741/g.88718 Transcript_54741/m.88718 type:complete len:226 (+) Transcript_54741:2-679(+)